MKIFISIIFLLTVACSSYKPPITLPVQRMRVVQADADSIWKTVIKFVSEHNIPIENMDHSSYFIKTKPVMIVKGEGGTNFTGETLPLVNEYCDCGEASIGNVWSTSSHIAYTYNIVLVPNLSSQTEVRVNAFFDGSYLGKRNFTSAGNDVGFDVKCVSKGTLEVKLLDYLEKMTPKKP